MEIMTVSEVSRAFDVSTRMLRYYEKMGLIESRRREDYAYRIYDEEAVRRLRLIVVMRKLRVPLKTIAVILDDYGQTEAFEILRGNIKELDEEIDALETIRGILKVFVERLGESIREKVHFDLLADDEIMKVANTLSLSTKVNLKEERSMNELDKANEVIEKNFDVRLVLLPPFTVAAAHFIGENPEEHVGDILNKFVQDSKLYEIKPDARMFGFNHPNPSEKLEHYGYECWATIPEGMEVPEPLVKKTFAGGLFAAHTIDFPNFGEWEQLSRWANNNDRFVPNYSELGEEIMGGCLEEHLNWIYSSHMGWPENGIDGKIDLLMPIKKK